MRKSRPQFLRIVFAESPQGVGGGRRADVSALESVTGAKSDSQSLVGIDSFTGTSLMAHVGPAAARFRAAVKVLLGIPS